MAYQPYLRSATCVAITLCRSTTKRQLWHWQSFQRQNFLWPFREETTPWFRHLAHFGVLEDRFMSETSLRSWVLEVFEEEKNQDWKSARKLCVKLYFSFLKMLRIWYLMSTWKSIPTLSFRLFLLNNRNNCEPKSLSSTSCIYISLLLWNITFSTSSLRAKLIVRDGSKSLQFIRNVSSVIWYNHNLFLSL